MVVKNPLTDAGTMTFQVLTESITFKITAEETDGAYTVVEATTAPGGGVPPHVQYKDSEAFYVLEGTYTFMKDGDVIELGPGGSVVIPIGTPHAFSNSGDAPARMLIMNSPGGIHQEFFMEIGVPIHDPENRPEVDMQQQIGRLLEIAPKYGIEMLPPAEAE